MFYELVSFSKATISKSQFKKIFLLVFEMKPEAPTESTPVNIYSCVFGTLFTTSFTCTQNEQIVLQLYKSTNFNIKVANKYFSVIENLCHFVHLAK